MKIYLAHNYAAKAMLRSQIVPWLEQRGHFVTSNWIKQANPKTETEGAIECFADVDAADTVIFFAYQHGDSPGKGKYAELGYAIAKGKRVICIGRAGSNCVFLHHPSVEHIESLEEIEVPHVAR